MIEAKNVNIFKLTDLYQKELSIYLSISKYLNQQLQGKLQCKSLTAAPVTITVHLGLHGDFNLIFLFVLLENNAY